MSPCGLVVVGSPLAGPNIQLETILDPLAWLAGIRGLAFAFGDEGGNSYV